MRIMKCFLSNIKYFITRCLRVCKLSPLLQIYIYFYKNNIIVIIFMVGFSLVHRSTKQNIYGVVKINEKAVFTNTKMVEG